MMTISQLFENSVSKYPNNTLVLEKGNGNTYQPISYLEIKSRVYHFAIGLLSLGVKREDRLALLSEGRSEWLISELGMLYLGAINVPLSVKINESEELAFRINHSGCRFVVVSERQLSKIRPLKNSLSTVEKLIVLTDNNEFLLEEDEISYQELLEIGTQEYTLKKDIFEQQWKSVSGNDLANISYTSGTTADPKGIMLSHNNYTANVAQAKTLIDVPEYYSSLLICLGIIHLDIL